MTKLLEKAFAEASKLSDAQQEAIASLLLEEIDSERKWSESFARSQSQLSEMAKNALSQFDQGKTRRFEKDSDLSHD